MTSIDSIVNRQLLRWELERKKADHEKESQPATPRIVTVSRQLGSRGSYFAQELANRLGYQNLHREIIDAICQSSGYRKKIIESLDERFRGQMDLLVETLLTGQSVDHSDYHRHLCRVVLSMSHLGGVVLTGRGGNFILGPKRGFHIRFVAPQETRIANLVRYTGVSESDAASRIQVSDIERKEFISKLFGADNDDSRQYDLVVNTQYVEVDDVLDITVELMGRKFQKLAGMA
jgi:cytidylate kinase